MINKKTSEILEIVDKDNQLTGKTGKRGEMHKKGIMHRTVNVFVFGPKGVLLQKRSAKRYMNPLAWDVSTAEHLKPGETYCQGAARGLKEELGIDVQPVRIRGPFLYKHDVPERKLIDREFSELYRADYDGKIKFDKEEVAEARFFDPEEIKKMIRKNPGQFTPWFLIDWKYMETMGLV
jgi:isopentenyl-diphosphate delta-isomerase